MIMGVVMVMSMICGERGIHECLTLYAKGAQAPGALDAEAAGAAEASAEGAADASAAGAEAPASAAMTTGLGW